MKIVIVHIEEFSFSLADVTQVGDPAPQWRKVPVEITASGLGITDKGVDVRLSRISLTAEESRAAHDLALKIAARLTEVPTA